MADRWPVSDTFSGCGWRLEMPPFPKQKGPHHPEGRGWKLDRLSIVFFQEPIRIEYSVWSSPNQNYGQGAHRTQRAAGPPARARRSRTHRTGNQPGAMGMRVFPRNVSASGPGAGRLRARARPFQAPISYISRATDPTDANGHKLTGGGASGGGRLWPGALRCVIMCDYVRPEKCLDTKKLLRARRPFHTTVAVFLNTIGGASTLWRGSQRGGGVEDSNGGCSCGAAAGENWGGFSIRSSPRVRNALIHWKQKAKKWDENTQKWEKKKGKWDC